MNKYGQIPPRLLESFGVAGLLGENCHVFYSVLFSTRHVGKVSDLLAAKLREAGVEDFQLRMAILVEVFEIAYSLQGEWNAPINVECGVDDEKVAIGVSFVLPPEVEIDAENFVEKIGDSQSAISRLSFFLRESCDRLVIKFEPKSRRYETCVLIPLTEVLTLEDRAVPAPPTLLLLTETQAGAQPPKAGVYTELGDVEYGKLLQDEKAKKEGKPLPPSAGERIAAAAQEEVIKKKIRREAEVTEEETKNIKGKAEKDNSKTKVSGSKEEADTTEKKFSGSKKDEEHAERKFAAEEKDKDQKTKVSGGEEGPGIIEKIKDALGLGGPKKPAAVEKSKVSGGAATEEESQTVIKGDSEELIKSKEKIRALEEKIAKLQSEALNRKDASVNAGSDKKVFKADEKVLEETVVFENGKKLLKKKVVKKPATAEAAPTEEAEEAKEGEQGPGILEKIMDALGIGGKKEPKKPVIKPVAEEEIEEVVEEITEGSAAASATKDGKKPAVAEDEVEILKEAAKEAESLVKQSEALDKTVERAKAESGALKDELKSPKAKKFIDGFMQEVIQEKAKIQEMAKKMNLSIRQKEFEFKNKERALQEEVRKRDEEIRAKTTAIMRAKERVTQLQMAMDQAKATSNKTDEAYKQKYVNAQKLLSQTQEQNTVLNANISELKLQVSQLKQRAPGNNSQFTELKTKFDRSQKQIEEYKKMNQQLLDKLNEAGNKKGGATGSLAVEEMKKKMENAIKLAQEQKEETETLKIKVDELEAESNRLRKELEVAAQKPAA